MKSVIMASGFGSRLWPLSTSDQPKQFQPLIQGTSLIQHVYEQLNAKPGDVYIETLQGLEKWVQQQLAEVNDQHLLLVPERRNTLPHLLFALKNLNIPEDENVLFVGSDTYAPNGTDLRDMLQALRTAVRAPGQLSLLGLTPRRADPTLGYLIADENDRVIKFLEKPPLAELEPLLASGQASVFYFAFVASLQALRVALDALDDQALVAKCRAYLDADTIDDRAAFLDMPFVDLEGVLRACANSKVVRATGQLLDIGKFAALRELNPRDTDGNVVIGRVIVEGGAANNIIVNQLESPLVVTHAQDMVIVQTAAGSLVCPLAESDAVGEIYKAKILAAS